MDERHWWIASKIQESFHIGGFDNPTMLEDFLCQPKTLETINDFLRAGGETTLIFYCEKPVSGTRTTRELNLATSLEDIIQVPMNETNIIYFLRSRTDNDVDMSYMQKDIFCGEIKGSILETLNYSMGELFLPLLKEKKDWSDCSNDNKSVLFHNLDRVMGIIRDSSVHSQTTKQMVLKRPENIETTDFKQQRTIAQDSNAVASYEALLAEWIATSEAVLSDARVDKHFDPTSGPLAELERWQRRQRLVGSITEQLKSKECKSVLSVLIAAKSRMLKKWKQIDAAVTDAVNETKDKVRFLESLRKHLEGFYADSTPYSLMTNVLPALLTTLKQMESVSRHYARTGYLGLLLSKITNQIVTICKNYISDWTMTDDVDCFWKVIEKEIFGTNQAIPEDVRQLISEYGENLEPSEKKITKKEKQSRTKETNGEKKGFLVRLAICFQLQRYYRDFLQKIPQAINYTAAPMSNYTSMSSLAMNSATGKSRPSASDAKTGQRSSVTTSPNKRNVLLADPNGINIQDEQNILAHLDFFCMRLRKVYDLTGTLSQFHRLRISSMGLPKPSMDEVVIDEKGNEKEYDRYRQGGADIVTIDDITIPSNPANSLKAIVEDDDEKEEGENSQGNEADEYYDALRRQSPTRLTLNEADLLHEFYPPTKDLKLCDSFNDVINNQFSKIAKQLADCLSTRIIFDLQSKDKDRFESAYSEFNFNIEKLELLLSAYLKAIFMRKMETREALQLLSKFESVQDRISTRLVISDKYSQVLSWYEDDVDRIGEIYEAEKSKPPIVRNVPPIAGAVSWVRQLLNRIEQPMNILSSKSAVSQLREFRRIIRSYNRLAETLVTFESLWLQRLKRDVEVARRLISSPLYKVEDGEVAVNLDQTLFQTMQEVRCLKRLKIPLTDQSKNLLEYEERFKYYRDQLELCISDFNAVKSLIPDHLLGLFTAHIDECKASFQPGFATVTWTSMNIDAFLHQTHRAIEKLKALCKKVQDIMDLKVGGAMQTIQQMVLFDYKLAFDRCWPPNEFTAAIVSSIQSKGQRLHDLVTTMETGIKECANLLTKSKGHTFYTLFATLKALKKWRQRIVIKRKPPNTARSTSSHQSSGDIPFSVQKQTKADQAAEELLNSYVEELYIVVEKAILRSLLILAESSGCDPDVLRSETPDSFDSPLSSRILRAQSARSCSRPTSVLSVLSNMTWTTEEAANVTYLRFNVSLNFNIPTISIEPRLEYIQSSLITVARAIVNVASGIVWLGGDMLGERLLRRLQNDSCVSKILAHLGGVMGHLEPTVQQHIQHLQMHEFLWKDDMVGNYNEFVSFDPGDEAMKREVERLLRIENQVLSIPERLPVGCVLLSTNPVRDALHGFAMTWKQKYASALHEQAKTKLDEALLYRNNVRRRLDVEVINLDQLNTTLCLLEELRDMENKIDAIYRPIEKMYTQLQEFNLRLPRREIDDLTSLRSEWSDLLNLAEEVRNRLLKERRNNFEQELDKQVKNFVVEVMQFRNAFDAQGPAVPGISPMVAVNRLKDFQNRYALYETKRKTLDSVSKLFGIPCKPFEELDRTGEELNLLGMLYGLFQKFIKFDEEFRDTLWADVDLKGAYSTVEEYWDECLALPSKLKDWDAYHEMKTAINNYLNILPLLQRLATREIRNRHWLQVMQVTGSAFQLEANVFKLCHLLDINLINHSDAIEEICYNAAHEQQLEIRLKQTEDEWTDQVLIFTHYKKRGNIYLDKKHTERLLEQLDDSKAMLANMLTSRHVGPMRDEAANWAEKLKQVSLVLEEWLATQDLWQYLEAVFSQEKAAKELPQEVKRFTRIDKGWTKMMKRAPKLVALCNAATVTMFPKQQFSVTFTKN